MTRWLWTLNAWIMECVGLTHTQKLQHMKILLGIKVKMSASFILSRHLPDHDLNIEIIALVLLGLDLCPTSLWPNLRQRDLKMLLF